jgi:hypothetical protein
VDDKNSVMHWWGRRGYSGGLGTLFWSENN